MSIIVGCIFRGYNNLNDQAQCSQYESLLYVGPGNYSLVSGGENSYNFENGP